MFQRSFYSIPTLINPFTNGRDIRDISTNFEQTVILTTKGGMYMHELQLSEELSHTGWKWVGYLNKKGA